MLTMTTLYISMKMISIHSPPQKNQQHRLTIYLGYSDKSTLSTAFFLDERPTWRERCGFFFSMTTTSVARSNHAIYCLCKCRTSGMNWFRQLIIIYRLDPSNTLIYKSWMFPFPLILQWLLLCVRYLKFSLNRLLMRPKRYL